MGLRGREDRLNVPVRHARPTWGARTRRWLHTGGWWVFVGAAVIVAAVSLFVDSRNSEADEQSANNNLTATAARGQTLADQILAACQTNSIPPQYENACNTAKDVSAQPVVVVPGPAGDQGPQGATGAQGIQGAQGLRGEKGERGEKGDKGDKGDQGNDGEKGDPGQDGQNGKAGKDGANGVDGQPGKDGADGRDGDPGCLAGTQPEPYTYPDGREGSRCVKPEAG